ncbi:MAG: PEP-CTERM sorting domain-containing protein [Phycisphaerae bacterium]|nr:PEP-CTERM sorting domain-containing protein [Phycisphaerae bacterium]
MMSRQIFFCCTLVIALVGVCNPVAFGWGGPSHSAMCKKVFDDPVVAPLISGFNQSTVEDWIGEPGDWQDGQWDNVAARAYIDTGVSPNGLNWQSLDETTRVKYMMHNLGDVAVPVGHSPACYNPGGFSDTGKEAYLEAQVALWSSYPSVTGTCNFTNSKTGHTYNYTGTYSQILSTHYNACRDNMTWSKSHLAGFPYFHDYNDYRAAGWNGTTIAQMLMRASFVDYMLSKLPEQAVCDGDHVLGPGQTTTFDGSASYDPDAITWNGNGTYSPTNAWMAGYYWDYNNDGVWDWVDNDPKDDNRSYDYLVGLGIPVGQWQTYILGVYDDEGHFDTCNDGRIYLVPGGVPEPASLSLLAVGGVSLLWRRKR